MKSRLRAWGLPLWDLLMGRTRPEAERPAARGPEAQRSDARQPQPSRPASARRKRRVADTTQGVADTAARDSAATHAPPIRRPRPATTAKQTMADRYDAMVRTMLAEHGVRVRKWRSAMSGVAWELKYHDGSVKRLIEAPRPRGPMSAAIFLHEIGHHAIGFNRYKPRCLEEYHAWAFALTQMERLGLNVTDAVRRRMHASLHYAIGKARRRGLATLPPELEPFLPPPPRSRRAKRRESNSR